MVNTVVVAGNLTRDIEVRRTQSGYPVVTFGIAVNDRKKNGQTGEWEDVPYFFDVTAFGERWEKLAEYFGKGSKVTVQGKLVQSTWQKDGQRRSKVEIVANEIELPPKGGGQQRSTTPSTQYSDASVYSDDDIPFD